MNRTCRIGMMASFFLLGSIPAMADLIADYGTGATGWWAAFPSTLTEGGANAPFWDNQSFDQAGGGVGFYLSGMTSFPNSPNYRPMWLGNANSAPWSVSFTRTSAINVQLLLTKTANNLEFGYYDLSSPGNMVKLFTTADAPGSSVTFTSQFATYGFYMRYLSSGSVATGNVFSSTTVPDDVYRSVISQSSGSETRYLGNVHQHFAVFAGPGGADNENYIIGVEDQWGLANVLNIPGRGNVREIFGDYQDLVIMVSNVPEPSTVVLVGLGLAAAAFGRRRFHRN